MVSSNTQNVNVLHSLINNYITVLMFNLLNFVEIGLPGDVGYSGPYGLDGLRGIKGIQVFFKFYLVIITSK